VIQHVAGGDYDRHDVEPWVDGGQAWKMDVRETTAIAAGPDDTLYFARGEVIGRIDPEHGSGHTIMELGTEQHACSFFKSNPRDARRAGDLWVGFVLGMAADGDGNLYLSDASCATVYRVAAGDDGRVDGDDPITLVAGTPNWLGEFDANLVHPDNALLQRLEYPRDLAVGADGALYIATNNQVLRLDLDTRTLSALTARNTTGLARCPGRHRTAAEVVISQPYGLAAGPTALFVASHDGNAVLKVGYPDGLGLDVTRVLGNCEKSSVTPDTVGDALAADLPITHPIALAAGPDESLFVLDRYSARMWRIDEDGALSSEVGGGTTRHTRGRPEDTKVDGRGALVAVDSSGDLVYYDNAHPWPTEAWKVDAHLRRLGGVCAVPIDSADGCVQDSDCGDGQQCTTDTCDLVHGCQYDPRPGPCDDGIDCTLDDICVAGLCQPGEWAVCDDGNPCTDDACDSAQGCTHTPAIGGCDDGDPCTTGDTCLNGWCAPGTGPDCMSSDCSSRPACEPLQDFGPMCAYGEPTAEIACAEMCAEALSCPQVSHTDDQESCRLDCEEIALALAPGAIDAWERCVFGESCDDIFAGAVLPDAGPLDACLTRAMETPEALAESQVVCAALVDRYGQCEAPSDEVEAFSQLCQGFYWLLRYEARTALGECVDMELSCEEARRRFDEVTCELLDVFIPSGDDGPYESAPPPWECEPEGTGPQCDDGNPCTNDLCAGGQCTHEPANGAACDDGDPCTESDSCGAGGCYGLPLSCDDGDDCTHDFCYPDEGCVHTPDQSPGCSGGGGE